MAYPIGTIGLSAYQLWWGNKEMKKLAREGRPNYEYNPNMQVLTNEAMSRRDMGYTPAEVDAFNQNLAAFNNLNYNRAMNTSGGNLSQTVRAILSGQTGQAMNQFAANDAALRRQNFQTATDLSKSQQIQNNLMVSEDINDYVRRMQDARATFNAGLGNAAKSADVSAEITDAKMKSLAKFMTTGGLG